VRAIFISYRRDDSEGEAGRLFDDLVNHFGDASVFMDVTAIQAGRDFRKAIDESVSTCGVLLAIIGKNWVDAKNEAGERRLDNASDFVRFETASALKRDIPVIPVLVHGAKMPRPDQLPDDLRDLAYRNGCELTHARWGSDLQLLIRALSAYVEDPKNPADSARRGVGGGAAIQPAPGPAKYESETDRTTAISPAPRWKSRGAIFAIVLSAVVAIVLAAYILIPTGANKKHLPDFSGVWVETNPEKGPPMRLDLRANGSQLTVRISYTEQFGGVIAQPIVENETAVWRTPQGCAAQFQKPGYNYSKPGENMFTLGLRGSLLIYEQQTTWIVPCDGHPAGVEKTTKTLRRSDA